MGDAVRTRPGDLGPGCRRGAGKQPGLGGPRAVSHGASLVRPELTARCEPASRGLGFLRPRPVPSPGPGAPQLSAQMVCWAAETGPQRLAGRPPARAAGVPVKQVHIRRATRRNVTSGEVSPRRTEASAGLWEPPASPDGLSRHAGRRVGSAPGRARGKRGPAGEEAAHGPRARGSHKAGRGGQAGRGV